MEEIQTQLKTVIKELFDVELEPEVTPAPDGTGADYATNVAMRLAKVAHKAPLAIAEEIKAKLAELGGGYTLEVAAPGFLNFTLNEAYFAEKISQYAGEEMLGIISPDE